MQLMAVALMWNVGLAAQQPDVPRRRWSISGTIGGVLGGPAASAAGRLEATGWGDTSPASCFLWCSEATDYPRTLSGASGELAIRYELTGRWAVSAGTTGRLVLGDARGYRHVPADGFSIFPGDHLDAHYEGSSQWLAGHIKPAGPLHAGLGIALHRVNNGTSTHDPVHEPSSHLRLGFMVEAGIRLGRESRLFWELVARGHWVPGSVRFVEPTGRHGPIALDVGLSYATITTGIGIRL
jgi:hypothetical protein